MYKFYEIVRKRIIDNGFELVNFGTEENPKYYVLFDDYKDMMI
jgi:hypothetical protein